MESSDISWIELALAWTSDASTLPPEFAHAISVGPSAERLVGVLSGGVLAAAITAAILSRTNGRLRDRFHAPSSETLDRNSERFLALAGERLGSLERSNIDALVKREAAVDAMVRPLRESLARVGEKLPKVETNRVGHYESLSTHLELVATSHRELERQIRGLNQALRTPNVGGRWGELQLRRVVELAGMLEHCDFQEQVSIDGEGGRQRPDLIVRLPGDRQIVIDAKAPRQAYLAAGEAEDDKARTLHLDEHARRVRRRVDDLGGGELLISTGGIARVRSALPLGKALLTRRRSPGTPN